MRTCRPCRTCRRWHRRSSSSSSSRTGCCAIAPSRRRRRRWDHTRRRRPSRDRTHPRGEVRPRHRVPRHRHPSPPPRRRSAYEDYDCGEYEHRGTNAVAARAIRRPRRWTMHPFAHTSRMAGAIAAAGAQGLTRDVVVARAVAVVVAPTPTTRRWMRDRPRPSLSSTSRLFIFHSEKEDARCSLGGALPVVCLPPQCFIPHMDENRRFLYGGSDRSPPPR